MTSNAGLESNGRTLDEPGREALREATADKDDDSSDAAVGEKEELEQQQQQEEETDKRRVTAIINKERRHEQEEHNTFDSAFGKVKNEAEAAQLNEEATLPPNLDVETPPSGSSSFAGPDEGPSLQNSARSSPRSSLPASRASSRLGLSPSPHPFDRRFKARISSSSSIPKVLSPAFLTARSRQSSISSQLTLRSQETETAESEPAARPWEVIRWTRLKKISQQAFSESGKRAFGKPTYLTIGASIAVGTSKGIILLFDYQQTLKTIIGQGTAATECGPVTALALSADHTAVAGGHADGTIFVWDLARPAQPLLHIAPLPRSALNARTSDDHIHGRGVLHVGFLGQRHTALASADDSGMAFAHLATRGLGALARNVKTSRLLGRYPDPSNTTRKPSSVLAFSPLPLGNVPRPTDDFGLTALLTPYLLVIVSTTPIAQTQYKAPRPKDIAAHSALTGCLCWFPAVKLREIAVENGNSISKTKLAYSWSNVLNVLEVDERPIDDYDAPGKRPELDFVQRGRWTCDEAILAVQWLSRSILAVLTITQRLIILEDKTFRLADSADLNSKHIHHADLFSHQLQPLVDKIEQGDGSMHGVLPDAYHMSFKAYKGRLFLLGANEVSMGTLSNWADRLTATLEAGNPITAVKLALSYYTGETDKVTIGLPDDDATRHEVVKVKLLDLLLGSLNYILNDESNRETEQTLRRILEDFARVAFRACTIMDEIDYLYDDMYEAYSDASMQDVFLYELESYILDSKLDLVPPTIMKDLLLWYETHDLGDRLQVIICSLQTDTMDIDQVSEVCRRLHLYDALIYVWNQALIDFVTPLIDLMALILDATARSLEDVSDEGELQPVMKMFPYMAYALTGRRYPGGEEMTSLQAVKAQSNVYSFLFANKTIRWPSPGGKEILFRNMAASASYPYLRYLLEFDSFSLLSMMNEAFEDSFLNDEEEQAVNGSAGHESFGASSGGPMSRQRIARILLEVVTPASFSAEDRILLDIFLARNLAKYPQDILLSGAVLRQLLIELCHNEQEDLTEECQLSVEYLLTVYAPSDPQELVALLLSARYFRALKSTYRSSKQYAQWLSTYFDDPADRHGVFECMRDCLRSGSGLSKRQVAEVKTIIIDHGADLLAIDPSSTALILLTYAPDLLDAVLSSGQDASYSQFLYLQALLERTEDGRKPTRELVREHQEHYVKLLCQHKPHHVAEYVTLAESGDLRLQEVLPAMEANRVVDAAVILLQHEGLARDAMDRLLSHLITLRTALLGIVGARSLDDSNLNEAEADLLREIEKYIRLGIWLCQGEVSKQQQQQRDSGLSIHGQRPPPRPSLQYTEEDLTRAELLWLDLLDAAVTIHQAIPPVDTQLEKQNAVKVETTTPNLRDLVGSTFTALLSSGISTQVTRNPPKDPSPHCATGPRFPPILSTLLTRLSHRTSSTTSVLPILSSLLSSHAFESGILSLAQSFLDKDVFALVAEADAERRRGWRPAGRGCEGCGRRCWGPGAGLGIWEAWDERRVRDEEARSKKLEIGLIEGAIDAVRGRSNGKGKERIVDAASGEEGKDGAEKPDALVLFKCQHLLHRACLEKALRGGVEDAEVEVEYQCPVCK